MREKKMGCGCCCVKCKQLQTCFSYNGCNKTTVREVFDAFSEDICVMPQHK